MIIFLKNAPAFLYLTWIFWKDRMQCLPTHMLRCPAFPILQIASLGHLKFAIPKSIDGNNIRPAGRTCGDHLMLASPYK